MSERREMDVWQDAIVNIVKTMLAVNGESLRNGGMEISGPIDFMGWTARYKLDIRKPSDFDDDGGEGGE